MFRKLWILLLLLTKISQCFHSYLPARTLKEHSESVCAHHKRNFRFPYCSLARSDLGGKVFTSTEIQDAARQIGMEISLSTLGPFYRSVIRFKSNSSSDQKGEIIGYTSGSVLPPLLRQDAMKIFSVNTGNQLSRNTTLKQQRGWTSPSTFGLTLILGAYGARFLVSNHSSVYFCQL